jgi:hypothetical protein
MIKMIRLELARRRRPYHSTINYWPPSGHTTGQLAPFEHDYALAAKISPGVPELREECQDNSWDTVERSRIFTQLFTPESSPEQLPELYKYNFESRLDPSINMLS